MSKARSMYAGSSGSNYGVNKNSPGNGNGKWQGLASITNMRPHLVPYVRTRTGGENRNVVFCMNQLGGVGRISNMFASTADGVHNESCAHSAGTALGAILAGSKTVTEDVINVADGPVVFGVDDFDDTDTSGSVKSFNGCDPGGSLPATQEEGSNAMQITSGRIVSKASYYNFTTISADIDLSFLNSIDSNSTGGANCNLYLVSGTDSDGAPLGKYCDAQGGGGQNPACYCMELDLLETANSRIAQATFHAGANSDGTPVGDNGVYDGSGTAKFGIFDDCASIASQPQINLGFNMQQPFTITLTVDETAELGFTLKYTQSGVDHDMTPPADDQSQTLSDGTTNRAPFKITGPEDAVYIVVGINSSYMAGGGIYNSSCGSGFDKDQPWNGLCNNNDNAFTDSNGDKVTAHFIIDNLTVE
tara:strand:- start:665 stop:1918 length:1254 start_codon:yes stop_codon:yes gene_type:complete